MSVNCFYLESLVPNQRLQILMKNDADKPVTGIAHGDLKVDAILVNTLSTSSDSLSAVSATLGSYTNCGWVEIDDVNHPGWYEFGFPHIYTQDDTNIRVVLNFEYDSYKTPVVVTFTHNVFDPYM